MDTQQVVTLLDDLEQHGLQVWVMGGWGVDALVGRQSRDHHDLDLLVEVQSLVRLRLRLEDLGFAFAYVWDEEVRWLDLEFLTGSERQPTAFVYEHQDGRAIDIHCVSTDGIGAVSTLWNSPYAITHEGLSGTGHIQGRRVACLTADMQRTAHTGYSLPEHHLQDLTLLDDISMRRASPSSSNKGPRS